MLAAFNRFRKFHWLFAALFVLAYLTGDDGELLHVWLGYGLLVVLALRLVLAPFRPRGFPNLAPPRQEWRKPSWGGVGKWLTFATLVSIALASVLGLGMIDNGEVLAAALPGVPLDVFGASNWLAGLGDLEEVHEFFANLALWMVALHIGYILLFRSKSVLPMLRGLPPQGPAPKGRSGREESVWQALQVSGKVQETPDSCSFELTPPAHAAARFAGKPGQFLTLQVPCDESPLARCYSLSRLPQPGQPLRITVKRVAGGRASNWLLDTLQPGDSILAIPPAGNFTLERGHGDLLLLGAGSGITPLRALLQAALQHGEGRVCLVYANRNEESVIFAGELAALQQRYPQRLQVVHWLDQRDGRLTVAALAHAAQDWRQADCFICGPQWFRDLAGQALAELAVPAQRIHLESYTSAAPAGSCESQGLKSRVRVALNGERHTLDVQPGEVLLDALDKAGLETPSACRSGVCAACKCRVTAGSATMRSNQALSDRQVAQGWVLACQAQPGSAELQVEY